MPSKTNGFSHLAITVPAANFVCLQHCLESLAFASNLDRIRKQLLTSQEDPKDGRDDGLDGTWSIWFSLGSSEQGHTLSTFISPQAGINLPFFTFSSTNTAQLPHNPLSSQQAYSTPPHPPSTQPTPPSSSPQDLHRSPNSACSNLDNSTPASPPSPSAPPSPTP